MADDRPATTSFSFSRFGRRLDQQKTTGTRVQTPSNHFAPPVKIVKRSPLKGDWLFRRIDRSQGSSYLPQQDTTTANRDYKPHFQALEKHIPTVSFEKQTKRRSMSLSNNQNEPFVIQTIPQKVKLMIPFDKQEGRKDQRRETVDKFYQPIETYKNNNAHSFESYSARKPLVEKEAMPDYDIQRSFNATRARRSTMVDFSKLAVQKQHIALTALLDYDVNQKKHIRSVVFEKQMPRDKLAFKNLFQRLQAKVQ